MATVYILECGDGGYYTGITTNLARRLLEHQQGQSYSTKERRPVILKWLKDVEDMATARRWEVLIKNRGANRFMLKNPL